MSDQEEVDADRLSEKARDAADGKRERVKATEKQIDCLKRFYAQLEMNMGGYNYELCEWAVANPEAMRKAMERLEEMISKGTTDEAEQIIYQRNISPLRAISILNGTQA